MIILVIISSLYFIRDEEVEKLRPIRNNLCDLFGVSRPVMKKVSKYA